MNKGISTTSLQGDRCTMPYMAHSFGPCPARPTPSSWTLALHGALLLLVLRYLFGFRGAVLITGAVAMDCGRCLAGEIESDLSGLVPP